MSSQPTHRITHGQGHGRNVTSVSQHPITGRQLVQRADGFMQYVDPSNLQALKPTAAPIPDPNAIQTFPPGDVRTSKQPFVPAPYSLDDPAILNQPSALPEYAAIDNRAITEDPDDNDDPDD